MSLLHHTPVASETRDLLAEMPQPARLLISQIVQSSEALKALMATEMAEPPLPTAEPITSATTDIAPTVIHDQVTLPSSAKSDRKYPERGHTSESGHRKHFFLTDDAERYGRDEAILLTDIRHWLRHNRDQQTGNTVHDGRQFFYSTQAEFQKRHPYYSLSQIRRILESLVTQGILIKGHYHRNSYLRDNWYTLDEPEFRLEALPDKICRNQPMDLLESANVHIENNKRVVTVNQLKLDDCLTLEPEPTIGDEAKPGIETAIAIGAENCAQVETPESVSCSPVDQDDGNIKTTAQTDTSELAEKTETANQTGTVAALEVPVESSARAPSITRKVDVIHTPDHQAPHEQSSARAHKIHRKAPASKTSKKSRTWTPPRRKPTRAALKQHHRTRDSTTPNTGVIQPMTKAPKPDWLEDALEWNPQATGFDFERCLDRLWDQLEQTRLPLDRHDPLDQTFVRTNLVRYFETAKKPGNDWALNYVCNGQYQRLGTQRRSGRISEARDRRNEGLAQLLDKQAQSFKTQSQTMRNHKTTLEKLTDCSWAEDLQPDSGAPPVVVDFYDDSFL